MTFWRRDPGECPICGAAHTACTSETDSITVVQMPARDAAVARDRPVPDETFTTGTYQRSARPRPTMKPSEP